jgi:hypothetical protein
MLNSFWGFYKKILFKNLPAGRGQKGGGLITMKIIYLFIGAWVVLGLGLGAPFCLAGEAKKGEMMSSETAPKEAGTDTFAQQKKEYQQKMETKLKEMNQELKEWKAKTKKMEKKAKVEAEKQLNALSKRKAAVSKRLKALKTKSGKAWEDLKAGTDSAMEDLRKAFDEVRSRFTS